MDFDRARYFELVCGLPERFLRTGALSHVYVKMRVVGAQEKYVTIPNHYHPTGRCA